MFADCPRFGSDENDLDELPDDEAEDTWAESRLAYLRERYAPPF